MVLPTSTWAPDLPAVGREVVSLLVEPRPQGPPPRHRADSGRQGGVHPHVVQLLRSDAGTRSVVRHLFAVVRAYV